MLLDLVRQYQDLIRAVEVERFRVVGTSYELKAVLLLKNGSQLFVKDYVFLDGTRKYAYHWQDSVGQLKELKEKHLGRFIAIEVDSGKYFLGDTAVEATRKAQAKHPGKIFFLGRIGYRAAYTFKGRR